MLLSSTGASDTALLELLQSLDTIPECELATCISVRCWSCGSLQGEPHTKEHTLSPESHMKKSTCLADIPPKKNVLHAEHAVAEHKKVLDAD